MPLLTIKQVMQELAIGSESTIHKYRKTGDMKFIDIRHSGSKRAKWRVDSRELERFKMMGTQSPAVPTGHSYRRAPVRCVSPRNPRTSRRSPSTVMGIQ